MAGVTVSIVQLGAGDERTSTISDIYTHFTKSVDREAVKS